MLWTCSWPGSRSGFQSPLQRWPRGVRQAAAWNLELCCQDLQFASKHGHHDTGPEGFDGDKLVGHAYGRYGMSFGVGLGELAGRRSGSVTSGALTEAQALSGFCDN